MGACNNKSNSQESSFQSSFSSFLYFNRVKGKIIQLHKKKLTKTKPKSTFFYSQDTSICHLSNRRLFLVGGSLDGNLSDESSILSLTSYKITITTRLPFKCRLGNLHEQGDWVYYIGAHLSMNGCQPAPVIKYNLKTNTWHEISEINDLTCPVRSLINFGSCFLGKEIMIVGGEVVDNGEVKDNKEIFVISLEKGLDCRALGKFPDALAFPVLAAGEKHGIVLGGVNLKTRAPSRKGFYVLLKDGKVEVHLLDKVAVDVLESYPPVYTKDYALFISYPNVVVRFKSQTQWTTFSLKSNKSKSKKNQFSWIKQQRLDFLKVTEPSNPSQILPKSKKSKSKSSSSSSSDSPKKKKKTKAKKPHHELSVKEKVVKKHSDEVEVNKQTSDLEVFEDIAIDPIKPNPHDSLNSNDHLQPVHLKTEFPKITVTRLDSEPFPNISPEPPSTSPIVLSSSTVNPSETNQSRSSTHSVKDSPISLPDSHIDLNSSNSSNSNKAELSSSAAVDSASQIRLKPEVAGSPRHNSEVIIRRNTPIHVKSLSSPDVLKFEGGNAINKVEITIKKRLSNLGKMLTEYTIKKQSSYSDSSSSSSSGGSRSGKKGKAFDEENLTVKKDKFKPGCVAEFLNISPRNNPSLILEGAENSKDSESSSSSSSSSKSSSSSSSSGSDSDSSSSDDSSSASFPMPVRVKRTHTIVSVNSSDVSDEDNDESINFTQEQFESFSVLVTSTLNLPTKLTHPSSLDIHSLYVQLQKSLPASTYSLSTHFFPFLSSIHQVVHKLPLKEKEKWSLVLTSHLLPEDDEISSSQLSYALSRAFKYILLRAR